MDSIYNLYKNKLDYTGRIQSSSKRLQLANELTQRSQVKIFYKGLPGNKGKLNIASTVVNTDRSFCR